LARPPRALTKLMGVCPHERARIRAWTLISWAKPGLTVRPSVRLRSFCKTCKSHRWYRAIKAPREVKQQAVSSMPKVTPSAPSLRVFFCAEQFSLITSVPPQPKKSEVHNQQSHYGDAGPIDPIENPECHGVTEVCINSVKQ
jgi:hypothetical protein